MTPLTPTGRALLAASIGVYAVGVGLGYPELLTLAAGGLLLLGLSAVPVLVRPRLAVERHFQPPRVTVGDPVLGQIEVRNRSRWPSPPFVVVDHLGRLPIEVRVAIVGSRGSRVMHYPIPTARRGRHQLGPVTVERRDPLGLMRRSQAHGQAGTLWVHPRTHRASPLPAGALLDYEGAVTPAAPKGAVTFSSLREYVPGDDPRQVHWKSSARTGTLMVKEHVDSSQPTTSVVVETGRAVLDEETFEQGLEVAASIVTAVERSGRPVTLHLLGEDRVAVERAGATCLLDRLAAIEQADGAGDPSQLLLLAEQAEPGGALVVVTGGAEQGTATRLAGLSRRFAPLVVIQLVAGASLSTNRHAGMMLIRAPGAPAAIGAWNRFVRGGRA